MLIILSGLPGSGKTTIARELSSRGVVHVRLDVVEQALVDSGRETHPVSAAGYYVVRAMTQDLLRQGFDVVADTVNPLTVTREMWRSVGGAEFREVEVFCSDPDLHRRRVTDRVADIPGHPEPTWEQVQRWDFEEWTGDRLRVDTAFTSPAAAADLILT